MTDEKMENKEMKRITIIGGAYGSGKTEFAMACALKKAALTDGKSGLIDLDIVNPYFRSRDRAVELKKLGVAVISTQAGLEYADLPALSPQIYSLLQDQTYQVVLDVGGDPAGARALGRFNPYFNREAYDFWAVVNPYRPDTRTPAAAAALIAAVETASRLRITGLVSNINLGPETTPAIWREGLPLITELADRLQLPLIYHMVESGFYQTNGNLAAETETELFPVELRMRPAWLLEA
jgi:hypothetical protein